MTNLEMKEGVVQLRELSTYNNGEEVPYLHNELSFRNLE